MFTLPLIQEEDIFKLDDLLGDLSEKCEATSILLVDKGGFVITKVGLTDQFDATTLGALGSASFASTEAMANLVNETNFTSIYQQGDHYSLLVHNVDEQCLLMVIFKASISVGMVKYYSTTTIRQIAALMISIRERAPGEGLDLSLLNLPDPSQVFKRKIPPPTSK